jgi:hypothetical protein
MIPDVYSAIALASVLDHYVALKELIAVSGLSSHSTGASAFGLVKNVAPVQKFLSEENIPFHSILAGGETSKSASIMVYECYLQSIHLHHDFLKIKLEDQLGLALSTITSQHYDDLRKYCNRVACNNGLGMDIVDRKTRKFKRQQRIEHLKKINDHLSRLFRQRTISCNKFGIQDVYGAVFLAKAVFLLETQHKHWKLDNLFRVIRRIVKNIFYIF